MTKKDRHIIYWGKDNVAMAVFVKRKGSAKLDPMTVFTDIEGFIDVDGDYDGAVRSIPDSVMMLNSWKHNVSIELAKAKEALIRAAKTYADSDNGAVNHNNKRDEPMIDIMHETIGCVIEIERECLGLDTQ